MFVKRNDKVGEAKVYLSQRELELEKELEDDHYQIDLGDDNGS